jgi:hypothetical protein
VTGASSPGDKPPFPIFSSREEAEAYSDQAGDSYYEICYFLEGQLNLSLMTMQEAYAQKPGGRRAMQSGVVRKMICREEFRVESRQLVLVCLGRYAEEETCHAYTVRQALTAWKLEQGFEKGAFDLSKPDAARTDMMLNRVCDWLESRMHFLTHQGWYECPAAFSPDADISHLSNLGATERYLANLSPRDKERFLGLLDRAAQKFDGNKVWTQVGKAMYDPEPRTWTHPQVDAIVISVWPLVLRYNWTYPDLLKVLDSLLPPPSPTEDRKYPLDSEASLKVHCRSVCGLTKTRKGKSASGMPEGWGIVAQMFKAKGK